MSIWNDIVNSEIGKAFADGFRKIFGTDTGALLIVFVGTTVWLLINAQERVSPPEHDRVMYKLDKCETRYDSIRNVLITAERFYAMQAQRWDSLRADYRLEIQKRDFLIQQYERTIKTATR